MKYKRLDGVQEALRALADRLCADGRQQLVLTDELRSFQSPMLVIWGNQDQVIPVDHANAAPESAETKILPGAGHSPHMEAAGDFNRTLEGFLAGVRAG
jgi:pyruvate dehydrogenase E2 component (dihydrolipoamide acetyltransferase)